MDARLRFALVLAVGPAVATAQDPSAVTPGSAEPPLPPGAVKRPGDPRRGRGARAARLAFSPDGTRLASWGNWLYFEDRLSVWDTATGREVFSRSMPEHQMADLGWG